MHDCDQREHRLLIPKGDSRVELNRNDKSSLPDLGADKVVVGGVAPVKKGQRGQRTGRPKSAGRQGSKTTSTLQCNREYKTAYSRK